MEGEPLTIGFNHHYILDCIEYMDGRAVIKLIDRTSPAVFHDYGDIDMTYLLLPVKV
jgi:DNA polymerase III sliding clamp (beta) subunit (PCNA family)